MNVVTPKYASISQLQKDLLEQKITVSELADYYLQRIADTKSLNIYISIYEQSVKKQAAQQDALIQAGKGKELGSLFGVFVNHKDVICYKDHSVTAGSKILSGFESLFTATVLDRILKEDALLIGRVNCDEFAMGSSNENSIYGPAHNPHDPEYIPGGSSGASAASVASDTCLASLGSDTGGSVRQPASFCGVAGMKPSYGVLSRYGLIAYGSSFDQIGFVSHDLDTIYRLLDAGRGEDPMDATSIEIDKKEIDLGSSWKFGYFADLDSPDFLDPPIKQAFEQFKVALITAGHEVVPVHFDYLDYLVPTYYILTTAEASTNLSRYDGVRYGYRSDNSQTLEDMYKNSRTEGFGMEVKRRLMMGSYVLSSGYYDAYYDKAQRVRQLIINQFSDHFDSIDYLFTPVTPTMPWKIGSMIDDPVKVYLTDILSVYANLAGIPAVSIPFSSHDHLPIGMQIAGPKGEDFSLVQVAKRISSAI